MNTGAKTAVGAVTVVVAAIGGVTLLGSAAWGAATGTAHLLSASTGDGSGQTLTADAQGVTEIDVETSAANMRVEFADIDQVQLVSDGSLDRWSLGVDEGTLEVRNNDRWFDWWSPDWWGDDQQLTLTLPELLRGTDADLSLNAGSLHADGDFGELDADVNAGDMTLDGSAQSVSVSVNAGRATVDLDGTSEAELEVSAGRLDAELATAPRQTSIDVSAGDLRLTVPDEEYQIFRDVSAGSLDSTVRESSSASLRIQADISAGSATVTPAR